jgi:soluble lytic murein transglycosylase-like protein
MARELQVVLAVSTAAAALLVADYVSTPFDAIFDAEGDASGVPGTLLRAIARHESGFRADVVGVPNPNGTRDYGLMQINDATARAMGLEVGKLLDPRYNVHAAVALLLRLKRELGNAYSPQTWIAAYNAGSPAILKRGVFNVAYTSEVTWHWQLYQLGSLVKSIGLGGRKS